MFRALPAVYAVHVFDVASVRPVPYPAWRVLFQPAERTFKQSLVYPSLLCHAFSLAHFCGIISIKMEVCYGLVQSHRLPYYRFRKFLCCLFYLLRNKEIMIL